MLTHIWGKVDLFLPLLGDGVNICFLEVSKALKSSNSLLLETADGNKVLYEVAHPCMCFNQQNPPLRGEWTWG